MYVEKDKPNTDPPKDDKTTPSREIPAFDARTAAKVWGISSNGQNGVRRRYPYSVT
jgi:hypothetical protein